MFTANQSSFYTSLNLANRGIQKLEAARQGKYSTRDAVEILSAGIGGMCRMLRLEGKLK